jgi:DNA repair exonuclease SbcCD ATPase subunit
MTLEERLAEITTLLEATVRLSLRNEEAIKRLTELAEAQQKTLATLIEVSNARMDRLEKTLQDYIQASNDYIQASNERMKQMEANLDALIRIITAEHSNGKGKLG